MPRIARKLNLAIEKAATEGKMLTGRQQLWIVYDQYEVDKGLSGLYGFEDLLSCKLVGGNAGAFGARIGCI